MAAKGISRACAKKQRSEDWIGFRQHNLTITAFEGIRRFGKGRSAYFSFRCDCGQSFSAQKSNVIDKRRDCGCSRASLGTSPAGYSANPLSKVWRGMIARCNNPSSKSYRDYGERGISVCPRWMEGESGKTGFECFIDDMGPRPAKFTIERDDFNGNYEPLNCRWISKPDQGKNCRGVRKITLHGTSHTLPEACGVLGLKYFTVHRRIQRGWSIEQALNTPVR